MRWVAWAVVTAALVALAGAAARRTDQDFEFDEDVEAGGAGGGAGAVRAPRRYVYEPHNSLCRSLVCKKREVCVLRDAFTALCASKKDILRKGDVIVTASTSAWEAPARDDDEEDVFYDSGAREPPAEPPAELPAEPRPDRCVGCGARSRGQFLCGSDNRTYSSLCRLDLHNCVHRARRPVTLACRGFCPCAAPPPAAAPPPPAPRRPHRARVRPPSPRLDYHYDDEWRRRKSESSHNEVLPERSARRRFSQGPEGCALDKMANRLLDWFSVLMDEAGEMAPPEDGFPEDCKPEVRWMFVHLDTDGDGSLSATNLYSLRHDERERCLRPFLSSCGGGAGVSRAAWCACLRRAARPCTALARAHPDPHPGEKPSLGREREHDESAGGEGAGGAGGGGVRAARPTTTRTAPAATASCDTNARRLARHHVPRQQPAGGAHCGGEYFTADILQ
ncbi:proteoglycan Cow isoform X2 [Manduca sexta]|uniref:proteoglycan Cow isoform X2 n=1 Tax=Manduca sexta TaxID=7130 RepID=UPI00188F745A|nr:proteoglycan Cow isoform X2 [Manduca sexta]